MTTTKIVGWVPVLKPRRLPLLYYPEDFSKRLKDFSLGLSEVLPVLSQSIQHVNTALKKPSTVILGNLQRLNRKHFFNTSHIIFIKIDCLVEFDEAAFYELNQEKNVSLTDNDIADFAAYELASTLEDAMLLADLAFPARIRSGTGCTYWGRKRMNEISASRGIYTEALYNMNLKWPPVRVVPFIKVCKWVKKLGLFDKGVARSPVQRALASFTHLTSLSEIGEALFWAMQGLEAFYCRGNGDLRRQLSEKSRLFLGQWDETKNIVGNLYDFRSKFIHGSFNLERRNNELMYSSEDDKDRDALFEATMFASRILLSTMQKCAEEDITNVDFYYSISVEHG